MARYVRITGFPETSEDVFGTTIRGLLAQGVPSILEPTPLTPQGRCMYRCIREGVSVACGAGLWIPDKSYRPDMEGRPFSLIAHQVDTKWTRPLWRSALGHMRELHDRSAKTWLRRGDRDWPAALLKGTEDYISEMPEIARDLHIPVDWEKFFQPE